jgi:uncharacterized membrane-anchored protein
MGKRHVHVVPVRKPVTAALLVLTSAAMIALIVLLSGRAYPAPAALSWPLTRDRMLALLMPVLANMLLFVPWGFLMFVVLDRPTRPRTRTYIVTIAGALAFAVTVHLWQELLPSRVTKASDIIANTLGAASGAILGHMRKGVRVRFDF